MGFSATQVQALRRNVNHRHVRTRLGNGRELSYIEGWHAVSEANRIFGFDGWDRETVDSRCVVTRETRGVFLAVYTSKVRITVRTADTTIVREGHGSGEARGASPGETHDLALKIAETDATKRALATFGKRFGLALHSGNKPRNLNDSRTSNSNGECVPAQASEVMNSRSPRQMGVDRSKAPRKIIGTNSIDKSVLTFGIVKRTRDKAHLRFVASNPCLLCKHQPSDPHHLRFAQPRALGLKVSDEFTVPLCRSHHRQLHHSGNEPAWWHDMGIEPLEIAKTLWEETHRQRLSNGTPTQAEVVDDKHLRSDIAPGHQ